MNHKCLVFVHSYSLGAANSGYHGSMNGHEVVDYKMVASNDWQNGRAGSEPETQRAAALP